ncbi:hypothetical protein [Pigmentiphaga litoralis]|uniref:hypothetical protein n=1 Tax=Pigmentiphaga litoralis TaxID=516702 RepID=UPI003B42F1B2
MIKTICVLMAVLVGCAGCISVPAGGSPTPAPACPFGQSSGSCAPDRDSNFCPPGDARKGACKVR